MEQEDYLETLYKLTQTQERVGISDLARALNVSKPSVTQMMQRLNKEKLVIYKPYSDLKLTKKGQEIGKKVAERHQVLTDFFTILGIPHQTQEKDIHGIEHFLSNITLQKLQTLTDHLKKDNYQG
ncbi:transcriptional regulator MntR [Candidatus Peregrinibacteria bacterium HGW-Peregrinibacteria-1]|jgi:Mn-dependent DtxR family transcriptional regulator|nr:MAG: transcriptional regulator MntR [Candidatus Peregrinibacteria bacterium HGW-Peregrinibacteria-1]